MQEARHAAITEIATRLLAVADAAYAAAPKLVLDEKQPDPPPLSWHVSYTSAQMIEIFIRLLTLRKMQSNPIEMKTMKPGAFKKVLAHTGYEANRILKFFNISLAQEIYSESEGRQDVDEKTAAGGSDDIAGKSDGGSGGFEIQLPKDHC